MMQKEEGAEGHLVSTWIWHWEFCSHALLGSIIQQISTGFTTARCFWIVGVLYDAGYLIRIGALTP